MKLARLLLLAVVASFLPIAAFAQTPVVFTNNDGTFTFDENPGDATQNELSLSTLSNGLGSMGQLTAISGLTAFGINNDAINYPCSPCLGTISLTTGALATGNITSSATFNPGGSFTVSYIDGVSFTGTFTKASWTSLGGGTWVFSGKIMGGVLTIGQSQYFIQSAADVQLTTNDAGATYHGTKKTYTFQDSGGTTNFSVAPEPGTLALFGSGLIVIGVLTRRRLGARTSVASENA